MSEDAQPAYDISDRRARNHLLIAADTPATVALVAAAGWPSAQVVGVDRPDAAIASVFAFDWRDTVADPLPVGIPSDCAILALVSMDTIDRADATLAGRNARFVFGDATALVAVELSDIAASLSSGRAHDSSTDERARLQALATELARLAEQLGELSSSDGMTSRVGLADRSDAYHAESPGEAGAVVAPDPKRIRSLIEMRRLRSRFFDASLFADPAWDMLLDLAASRLEGRSVSVSSLCIAAAVPPTTALRWIRMMTDQQLLVRRADPGDARRMFIDLADGPFDKLCGWFALVDARGTPGI